MRNAESEKIDGGIENQETRTSGRQGIRGPGTRLHVDCRIKKPNLFFLLRYGDRLDLSNPN